MNFTEPIIRNRKGDTKKPWYIEFEIENKRIRIKSGKEFGVTGKGNRTQDKRQRQVYFQDLQQAIKKALKEGWSPIKQKSNTTITEALKIALTEKRKTNSKTTMTDYESRVRQFKEFLKRKRLTNVKATEITKEITEQFFETKKNLKQKTLNNYTIALHALFNVMIEEKIISENPISGRKKPKTISETHQTYEPGELKKVLSYIKENYPKLHLCCLLEYHCFMRPQFEIRMLKWEDLDLKKKTIKVIPENAKGSEARILPLHLDVLKALGNINKVSEFIFAGKNKREPVNKDYFGTQFKRVKQKLKLKKGVTLYAFKHTGACNLYMQTKDIYLVSKKCGHTTIKTTENYLRSLGLNIFFHEENHLPSVF